jgi:hypothetical protein
VGYDGSLYFLREELIPEFTDEIRYKSLTTEKIAPNLYFASTTERLFWVLDYWPVRRLQFVSISDAARQLRRYGKFWVYVGAQAFRRGQLIADQLHVRKIKEPLKNRGVTAPSQPSTEKFDYSC